jgi:hypothetical protein
VKDTGEKDSIELGPGETTSWINDFVRSLTVIDDPMDFFTSLETYFGGAICQKIELYINHNKNPDLKLFVRWEFARGKIKNAVIRQEDIGSDELKTLFNGTCKVFKESKPNTEESIIKILMPLTVKKSLLKLEVSQPFQDYLIPHEILSLTKDLITIWLNGMFHKFTIDDPSLINLKKEVLKPRQLLIFDLMIAGDTNKTIGKKLGFSESLVKAESSKIFAALGISSRQDILGEKFLK